MSIQSLPAPSVPTDVLPLTDEELLRKIRQSAAGYRFQQLWRGRNLHHPTAASADREMCRLLAAWGGPFPERIDRLFRLSGRMCDRWDESWEGCTYGECTILAALGKADIPGDPDRPLSRRLQLRWGDTVEAKAIEWLWPEWLPRGVLAVLDGDPGLGKSSVTLDLVARVTTGANFPHETGAQRPPQCVLVAAPEDSTAHVVKPRLEAAGADVARVAFVEGVVERTAQGEETCTLQLPRDLDLVAKAVREHRPALLVIDPLFAVMGLDRRGRFLKASDDQSVRRLTGELKQLAEEAALTVLLIRHLNKNRRGSAELRGSGSVAIAGQARAVLLAAKDPADPDARVLAMAKTNMGALPRSLRFVVGEGRSSVGTCSQVAWLGTCDLTADDLLNPPQTREIDEDEDDEGAYGEARAFLVRLLAEGPKTWAEIVTAGRGEGLAQWTLRMVRQDLGLVRSGRGPGTRWSLPAPSSQ
jgi:hypothetical protein